MLLVMCNTHQITACDLTVIANYQFYAYHIYIVTVSESSEIMQFQVTVAMNCKNMHEYRLCGMSHMNKQSFISQKE
jgi:hypothetical protein